mmetsp:Transcript_24845/g.49541  ORF Transcript_24845/g.49541 Transcript_24845/m.49541 type:complete len:386 (-) Transcript_24845:94-1251(-)
MCCEEHPKEYDYRSGYESAHGRAHVRCDIIVNDGFHSRSLNECRNIVRRSLITFVVSRNMTHGQIRMTADESANGNIQFSPIKSDLLPQLPRTRETPRRRCIDGNVHAPKSRRVPRKSTGEEKTHRIRISHDAPQKLRQPPQQSALRHGSETGGHRRGQKCFDRRIVGLSRGWGWSAPSPGIGVRAGARHGVAQIEIAVFVVVVVQAVVKVHYGSVRGCVCRSIRLRHGMSRRLGGGHARIVISISSGRSIRSLFRSGLRSRGRRHTGFSPLPAPRLLPFQFLHFPLLRPHLFDHQRLLRKPRRHPPRGDKSQYPRNRPRGPFPRQQRHRQPRPVNASGHHPIRHEYFRRQDRPNGAPPRRDAEELKDHRGGGHSDEGFPAEGSR